MEYIEMNNMEAETAPQKNRKKILRSVVNTLLVLIITFCLFVIYGNINNRFYRLVTVTSGSMSPTFEAGDLIFIVPLDSSKAKIGDVVIFKTEQGSLLTHRIIDMKGDGEIITQGDANDVADSWDDGWKLKKVEAKYVFRIPKLGYVMSWFGGLFHSTDANLKDVITSTDNQIAAAVPTPTDETPAGMAQAEETPTKEATAEKTPKEETQTEETLTGDTSAKETPTEELPLVDMTLSQ